MRLSYVLVATAATLLATCHAGIADQSKLASVPLNHAEVTNISNRFLRSREMVEEKAEDPADDEERFLKIPKLASFKGDFAPYKLKRMLKDEEFKFKMLKKWYQNKRSVETVTKNLPEKFKEDPRYQSLVADYDWYRGLHRPPKPLLKID